MPALRLAAIALLVALPAQGDDDEQLRRMVDHTISTQLPNGFFTYDFDFLRGESTGQDNIVRQAGALFALGEVLVDTGDARLVPVLRSGLERMEAVSLPVGRAGLQSALESLGVYSIQSWRLEQLLKRNELLFRPEGEGRLVAQDGSYDKAWAGATALALIGELEYFRATGDERFAEIRRRWVEGLRFLHVPGRGIRGHPNTLTESTYFNGETWLALAYHQEAFPDDELVAETLEELETYLLQRYGERRDKQFFHWGSMTSAVRWRTTKDPRFVDFAAGLVDWFLEQTPSDKTRLYSSCSIIEGLASAYSVLEGQAEHAALAERVRDRVALEMERNRALQIQAGQESLELGGGALLLAPLLSDYAGAILMGPFRPETRVDVTQHCVSAFSKVRRHGVLAGIPAGSDP